MPRLANETSTGIKIPTFSIHRVCFCLLPACLASAVPAALTRWAEWSVTAYDGNDDRSETIVGWLCPDMPTRQRTGRGRIVCVSAYPDMPLGYIRHVTQARDGLRIVARGSYGHLRRTGRPRTARPGQAVMPR